MHNRFKYKLLISLLLLSVFIFPQVVKYQHVLTVHHYKTHCTAKHEKHFHKSTEHCSIHDYAFIPLYRTELLPRLSKIEFRLSAAIISNKIASKSNTHHRYYLRGPPDNKC